MKSKRASELQKKKSLSSFSEYIPKQNVHAEFAECNTFLKYLDKEIGAVFLRYEFSLANCDIQSFLLGRETAACKQWLQEQPMIFYELEHNKQ